MVEHLSHPMTAESPLVWPGPVPARADVVVIGGGVMGIMSALYLGRAGLRVVVLEKGRVAGEQSSRNWGWIRAQGRDWGELPIAMEAKRLWTQLAAQCDTDIGLRQTGVHYLATSAKAMARHEAWQARAVEAGLDCERLSAAQVAKMLPEAETAWVGGIKTASDMRAEPHLAVPAVARLAAKEGVQIYEGCAVRGLERAAGTVSGVVTEKGVVQTREVVVAGGAWSRLFLQAQGVRIPQLAVRSTVVATQPLPQLFGGQMADTNLAFRPRIYGGYVLASGGRNELTLGRDAFASVRDYAPVMRQEPFGTGFRLNAPRGFPDAWGTPRRWRLDAVSPFERQRVLNPAPNEKRVQAALRRFEKLFPCLGPVEVRVAWAGMIDTMPDFVPVVDRVAAVPGLTVATGLSGHGFGIGPAFGRVVAQLVTQESQAHDISRFRLSRFDEGPLTLGPTL